MYDGLVNEDLEYVDLVRAYPPSARHHYRLHCTIDFCQPLICVDGYGVDPGDVGADLVLVGLVVFVESRLEPLVLVSHCREDCPRVLIDLH